MIDATSVLDHWEERFAAAVRASPAEIVDYCYSFAGYDVWLRVVGRTLATHIHAPFAHLAMSAGVSTEPVLRIELWDEAVTGVPCPSPPEEGGLNAVRAPTGGTVSRLRDGEIVYYARDTAVLWLDRQAQRIFGWYADGRALLSFERTRPLPQILAEWYRDRGVPLVHAGLVARGDRGLLLAGWSGAGKSSAAIACLLGGFYFLGDDQVGLRAPAGDLFLGYSVYNSSRLATQQLARFPSLQAAALLPDGEDEPKSLVFLAQVVPAQLRVSVPVRAIVLPRVVATSGCSVHLAGASEALQILGPSTLLGLPHRTGSLELRHIARLVAAVPAFRLEMSQDIAAIAPCLAALLEDLEAGAAR